MKPNIFALVCALVATPLSAGEGHKPYAGLQARDISSLSQEDIEELQRGGGWGLALPAELNGYPGPAHVLELREELNLGPSQVAAVQVIFEEMRTEAVLIGRELIEAERSLDAAFRGQTMTPQKLQTLLDETERHRSALRFVHLSRHLQTVDILTETQIGSYNAQRGYTADPCERVPHGHNEAMWRKHNGCED